jgi:SsrA-binding protein
MKINNNEIKILNQNPKINKHFYKILDEYQAGICLNGSDVKPIKLGKVDISKSYIKINENKFDVVIYNIYIRNQPNLKKQNSFNKPYFKKNLFRNLLLKKNEIIRIKRKIKLKKLVLLPRNIFLNKKNIIKLKITLCKKKRTFDKKKKIIEKEYKKNILNTLFL